MRQVGQVSPVGRYSECSSGVVKDRQRRDSQTESGKIDKSKKKKSSKQDII